MEKVAIFEIVKPQGIKGELKVKPLADDVSFYSDIEEVFVSSEKETRKIISLDFRGGFGYITLSGIDINRANLLRGKEIFISRELMKSKMADDEILMDDIIGFKVVYGDNKEEIGVLDDIQNFGSSDVFYVKNNKKEILFSNIDGVIAEIDENKKLILVDRKKFLEVACENWYINTFSRNVCAT